MQYVNRLGSLVVHNYLDIGYTMPRKMQLKSALLALLLFLIPATGHASAQNFSSWLEGVKQDARAKGISQATINAAFAHVQYLPRVIELDRKQPETTISFSHYIQRVLPSSRIQKAQKLYRENAALLNAIGKRYGVQPRFIVALWGIESNFGENTGGFSIIDSLATLAHDGRRSEFFRDELMKALKIIDQGHIRAEEMKGSWAGAMGQTQFMPSSFLKFAVDYDGDGKQDIWKNKADAFASIANYLSKEGWNDEYTWGRQVKIPANLSRDYISIDRADSLHVWKTRGIQTTTGGVLPEADIRASLVKPGETDALYYLVYPNYKVILKWNRSKYFATAVGIFADSI